MSRENLKGCLKCRYFDQLEGQEAAGITELFKGAGRCRLNGPVNDGKWMWPVVRHTEWCGKWEKGK